MSNQTTPSWHFIDKDGTFRLNSPDSTSYLYFPLVNDAEMLSCITPTLHGDIKSGQNTFLTRPVSVEDLHESRAARNVWVSIDGYQPWSASGNSAKQLSERYASDVQEESSLEAGFLWHAVNRVHLQSGLSATITNFIPQSKDQVELMKVTLENKGKSMLKLSTTIAIPVYGRSADNLRDHRHVTALFNRIQVHPNGITLRPSLSFNERRHRKVDIEYSILGCEQDGNPPVDIFPLLEEFRGEGGTLDWPQAVIENQPAHHQPGDVIEGYEALGGMRFRKIEIAPGENFSYIIILAIAQPPIPVEELISKYGKESQFNAWLSSTNKHWKEQLDKVRIHTADQRFDGWVRWISAQPIFRRLYGNSFLPYHDYGRGGRGWRDLWQDVLGLLLMGTEDIGETLISYFAGVRFDGSNATIIGHKPGEFKADRNNIQRVWMDHGAWPLMTTRMYLDWTGNIDFLFREQAYFKDQNSHRNRAIDDRWEPDQGTQLKETDGSPHLGSVFEHLLVENLVPFFNVGEHNCILLEDADWNDAFDMAPKRGESVAFTGFYTWNLAELADLAKILVAKGVKEITLARELSLLLDTIDDPIPYNDPHEKKKRLNKYFDSCTHALSGEKITIPLSDLIKDLESKSLWTTQFLREQEWIKNGDHGWFNGYYDDQGRRLEGVFNNTEQITLTAQVFQIMSGIATNNQTQKIIKSVDKYLYDPDLHGIRLNSKFQYNIDSIGRCFDFAYGHKENGAMFSHMAVMYSNALFKRGFNAQAHKILHELYDHCQDFSVCRAYPGLPEYLDPRGRGMYPYLTGSASWYLLTFITQVYGVRGYLGDLLIDPAIDPSMFDELGQTSVRIAFAGRLLELVFIKPEIIRDLHMRPDHIKLGEQVLDTLPSEKGLLIPRTLLQDLPEGTVHRLEIFLEQE